MQPNRQDNFDIWMSTAGGLILISMIGLVVNPTQGTRFSGVYEVVQEGGLIPRLALFFAFQNLLFARLTQANPFSSETRRRRVMQFALAPLAVSVLGAIVGMARSVPDFAHFFVSVPATLICLFVASRLRAPAPVNP